jgi:hypothetical protein
MLVRVPLEKKERKTGREKRLIVLSTSGEQLFLSLIFLSASGK